MQEMTSEDSLEPTGYIKAKMKSIELYEECKNLYLEGSSLSKLEREKNINRHTFANWLKEQEIEIRNPGSYARKYDLDEHYFDVIDTEEKAYFLGYLYADGCNHSDITRISIQLSIIDKEILQKFSHFVYKDEILSYNKVINKEGKEFEYVRLLMHSTHMTQQLSKLGMTPRKSFSLTFPNWLDVNLYHHFLRGLIDGDGWIFLSSEDAKRNESCVGLICTRQINDFLLDFFKQDLGLKAYLSKAHSQDFEVMCDIRLKGYANQKKFLTWLYKDATIYLERKYQYYQELLIRYNELRNQDKLLEDRDDYKLYAKYKEMYLNGVSLRELERQELINRKTFTAWLKNEGVIIRGSDELIFTNFTEEQKQEYKQLYLSGMTLQEIEDEKGINSTKFSIWLKEQEVEVYNRKLPTIETYEECKEMYLEGMTLNKIAENKNITPLTISRNLKEMGIEIIPGNRININLYEEAKLLYLAGKTIKEIVKQKKIDPATFSNWLKEQGVEINKKHRGSSSRKLNSQMLYEEGKELYLSGMSILQIEKEKGIKRQNFTKWLKEQGVVLRSKQEQELLRIQKNNGEVENE